MRICDLVVVIRILFSLQSLFLWLSQNQLDVTCYKMTPYVDPLSKQVILDMQKILPVRDCSDFFIKVESSPNLRSEGRKEPFRRNLPKLREMIELQILESGDILIPKGYEFEAELLENGNVMTEQGEKALSEWLKTFGWTSGNIYDCTTQKRSGKTLSELRVEYVVKKKEDNSTISLMKAHIIHAILLPDQNTR